jgi:uncharacterized membrane protein YdbT with pleckstrin-like domain
MPNNAPPQGGRINKLASEEMAAGMVYDAQDFPDQAEVQRRHQKCVEEYPNLHLSQNEYVIDVARRHVIGILGIWIATGFIALVALIVPIIYAANRANIAAVFGGGANAAPSTTLIAIPMLIVAGLFLLGGWAASYVYSKNMLTLTNESLIQSIRFSLFNSTDKTANLRNIRDASYDQDGILPRLFNYGTLTVTTEGNDQGYKLTFVTNPKVHSQAIVDAHEHAIAGFASAADPSDPT